MVAKGKGQLQFEGTWEEVQRNSHHLSGRRVRVTTIDEVDAQSTTPAMQQLLDAIDGAAVASPPPLKGAAAPFANHIAKDLDRQRRGA